MPPRRSTRRNSTSTPPPPPPPIMDTVMFQTAVTAAVTAVMAQMSNNGSGGGTNSFTNGQGQGHSGVCTYKDFTNGKPIPFYGTGGVLALSQWIEKTEAVFEICACPEESKVKFAAFTCLLYTSPSPRDS